MKDSDRLILVTGGTGYVGTAVVPRIAKRYLVRAVDTQMFGNAIAGTPNVEFVKADIQDYKAMRAAMRGVTDVIHLAGIVTDELVDMNHVKAMRINLLGTQQVARAAYEAGVGRLIFASSSSVYGSQPEIATEDTPPKPQSVYAATKLVGEDIVNSYSQSMTVCSLRCSTCCGPSPRMRLDTIVNVFSKQAYFDGKITVHGGDQYRTNAHINDVARLYEFLLDAPAGKINGEAFNFTSGNHTAQTLGVIVGSQVASLTDNRVEVNIDTSKHDLRSYRMDAGKIERVLGFKAEKTIEDAVRDNITFFRAGGITDPNSDLYVNTRRMQGVMRAAN